jgi:hypothetical protein
MVVDPLLKEEVVMDGRITVAINGHRELCTVQKAGGCAIEIDRILECARIAAVKVEENTQLILKALKENPPGYVFLSFSVSLSFFLSFSHFLIFFSYSIRKSVSSISSDSTVQLPSQIQKKMTIKSQQAEAMEVDDVAVTDHRQAFDRDMTEFVNENATKLPVAQTPLVAPSSKRLSSSSTPVSKTDLSKPSESSAKPRSKHSSAEQRDELASARTVQSIDVSSESEEETQTTMLLSIKNDNAVEATTKTAATTTSSKSTKSTTPATTTTPKKKLSDIASSAPLDLTAAVKKKKTSNKN